MNLIDTHAHLYWDSYKADLPQVLQKALEADVKTVINIGTDLETSKQAVNQDLNSLNHYCSIGIHPHEANILITDESIHQNIGELEKLYQSDTKKVVAIGECGLDYHFKDEFNTSSLSTDQIKANQLKLFISQIELAKKLNLPLIIHCRDAWDDIFIPHLNETTGLFHNFTGSLDNAQKALDLGYYLAFSCIITYPKNDNLRHILSSTPLDKILTETDCPFLPPQSIRGQRNEPSNIDEIIKVISEVKNLSIKEVAEIVFNNSKQLFKF